MEVKVILRGALSGLVASVLALVFSVIFAEPQITKAIDYESGRDDAIAALNKAAGRAVSPDGPEIFSRGIQMTVGIATGLILFSMAMGAIVAVAFVVLRGRFAVTQRTLALCCAAFGFLGIFAVPFVKYPANPPAIGHDFTVATRGHLYLAMVGCSLLFLGVTVYVGHRFLLPRFGTFNGSLIAAAGFVVAISIVIALLPSLGNLSANVAAQGDFGYARASTETPQPITDLSGHLVYPGFPADVLWKFRWYSLLNQLLIWTTIGLVFSALLGRMGRAPRPKAPRGAVEAPAPIAAGV